MTPSAIVACCFFGLLLLTYAAASAFNAYHDAQPEIDAHTFMAETVPQWIAEEMEQR